MLARDVIYVHHRYIETERHTKPISAGHGGNRERELGCRGIAKRDSFAAGNGLPIINKAVIVAEEPEHVRIDHQLGMKRATTEMDAANIALRTS